MALTTATAVANMVDGIQEADVTAAGVIDRVGTLFARWCGYPPASVGAPPSMESTTYTLYTGDPGVYLDSRSRRELVIEPYPVTSITSIHDDPNEDYTAADLVDSSSYDQRGRHGERIRLKQDGTHTVWSRGERAVKVVAVAGFASVPEDLEAAAIEMCAHMMRLRHARGEINANTGEGTTVSFRDETMPGLVKQLLGPFRLPSVFVP